MLFPAPVGERVYAQFGAVVAAAREQLSAGALNAQKAAMDAWHDRPAGDRLAAIEAPTLVAAGSEDVVIPPVNSEYLASALPGSWLARFPGGGHAFMAQEPERLAKLINAFLER